VQLILSSAPIRKQSHQSAEKTLNMASATVKNGIGHLTFTNGKYYGGIKDGNMHGKGKRSYADDAVYEGDYEDGYMHGTGKFSWPSGSVYEGDYKDDHQHGKGKFSYASGEVYEGDFEDGKKHGKGKYSRADGSVYHEGYWKCDKKQETVEPKTVEPKNCYNNDEKQQKLKIVEREQIKEEQRVERERVEKERVEREKVEKEKAERERMERETDLFSRICCICEVMFAKKYNVIPDKIQITGPDRFSTTHVSCLDAKSFSPEDKEKIMRELLTEKGSRAEIDRYIKEFRDFITGGGDAVDVQISNEKNETLEGFLGEKFFSAMKTELDDIGVGEVEDLKLLETEDLNKLAAKLKKIQAKKFLMKMSEFIDRD